MVAGITGEVIVEWIAPDGRRLHLDGGADAVREGIGLQDGAEGLGELNGEHNFGATAKQIGETSLGVVFDHGEYDLPLFVYGKNSADLQHTREQLKSMFSRKQAGWLAVYTPVTGWRWSRCKLKSMRPSLAASPYPSKFLAIDVVLVAEDPRSETRPYSSQWRNKGGSGVGVLWLSPGIEWASWPTFVVHGPGAVTLTVNGSKIRLPKLDAGERCLMQTDPSIGVLRSIAADGRSTNRWPDVDGYLSAPLPEGRMSRVDIRVEDGNRDTAVMGHTRVYGEGLL
ncbi:hypothetical protein AALF15_01390 [Corynebacteriaceae bacterium 7-707]